MHCSLAAGWQQPIAPRCQWYCVIILPTYCPGTEALLPPAKILLHGAPPHHHQHQHHHWHHQHHQQPCPVASSWNPSQLPHSSGANQSSFGPSHFAAPILSKPSLGARRITLPSLLLRCECPCERQSSCRATPLGSFGRPADMAKCNTESSTEIRILELDAVPEDSASEWIIA